MEAEGSYLAETDPMIVLALSRLPSLSQNEIPNSEDSCPICLVSFKDILESYNAPSPVGGSRVTGVTKVEACGHVFCLEECVI